MPESLSADSDESTAGLRFLAVLSYFCPFSCLPEYVILNLAKDDG